MKHRARRLANLKAVSYSERTMAGGKGVTRAGERGQAMTEYVVILFGAMLTLLTILGPMADSIQRYMKSIYFCVSLPYP
jgi:hypothetical protein